MTSSGLIFHEQTPSQTHKNSQTWNLASADCPPVSYDAEFLLAVLHIQSESRAKMSPGCAIWFEAKPKNLGCVEKKRALVSYPPGETNILASKLARQDSRSVSCLFPVICGLSGLQGPGQSNDEVRVPRNLEQIAFLTACAVTCFGGSVTPKPGECAVYLLVLYVV